jgi:hypothetical protein
MGQHRVERGNDGGMGQVSGFFCHGSYLIKKKSRGQGQSAAILKNGRRMRPSKRPSFVYRQDGYELSYEISYIMM